MSSSLSQKGVPRQIQILDVHVVRGAQVVGANISHFLHRLELLAELLGQHNVSLGPRARIFRAIYSCASIPDDDCNRVLDLQCETQTLDTNSQWVLRTMWHTQTADTI